VIETRAPHPVRTRANADLERASVTCHATR
jgi:hypothetical protein